MSDTMAVVLFMGCLFGCQAYFFGIAPMVNWLHDRNKRRRAL